MKQNVGTVDRAIRAIAGVGLIAWGLTQGPQWLAWVGLVPLGTAVIGWCPAYWPFGLSSRKSVSE